MIFVIIVGSRDSVCRVTRVLADNTKEHTADILISHERAIALPFRRHQWLGNPLEFALKVTHPFFVDTVLHTKF